MSKDTRQPEPGDAIARLIRLAGPRTRIPPESADRVRNVVGHAWRLSVRHRRRRRALWGSVGSLAAAGVIGLLFAGSEAELAPDLGPVPLVRVAHVERTDGMPMVIVAAGERRPLMAGVEIQEGEILETGAEGRLALRLETGHSVRLDRHSRLRVLDGALLALDRGAVYVDSGGASTPVEVSTERGRVEEVGTQFEVRLQESALRIRVREGSIQLDGREDVSAGSELTVHEDGSRRRGAILAHGPDWQWTQEIAPVFDLEGSTLAEFLVWASRETGRRVEYEDLAIRVGSGDVELHGDLEAMSPEQALAAVLPTCGLRHRLVESGLRIEEAL